MCLFWGAAHRANGGQMGVPELHSASGGQRGQAPQLAIIFHIAHLVVLLPPVWLRMRTVASAAWQKNLCDSEDCQRDLHHTSKVPQAHLTRVPSWAAGQGSGKHQLRKGTIHTCGISGEVSLQHYFWQASRSQGWGFLQVSCSA